VGGKEAERHGIREAGRQGVCTFICGVHAMVVHQGTHKPQTGETREKIVKTWGPIAAKEWTSTWHHVALTLRFAHTVRGAELEPEVNV